jgi:WD40 repeat protein/transcriptional regulator with XRE-family HTH domain
LGRRERPLDPADGPVARFAFELRKLRQEAGGPTYRVMAGRAHYSPATLAQAAAGDRLPSLAVAEAYAEACGGDVEEWRRRWREAGREAREEAAAADDSAAPYLGLTRFETEDSDLFFGRAALVERLAALVREHRLVMLVGPSGSGKSSLLRAGLVPWLRQAARPGERPASIRVLTPGAEPEFPGRTHDVVIVDQFEELFTLCADPARRARFIDALLAGDGGRVVLAVRADFFGRCAEHRELAEAVRDATTLMSPMSPAELREAITGPAAKAGLVVERELTARIVGEVAGEPGGLPLMSHALLETWRRRHGRVLTTAAYEDAGGIRTAIARTSEELYTGLTADQRERLRPLLLRLVTPGHGAQDTRRPVDRAELLTGDDDTEPLLERLAQARLITLDGERVDLAHEALLTAWPRLRGWIEEDRERIRQQRLLTEAARAWHDHDRDPGGLYRGARLSIAAEQFASFDGLTPLEREFLTAGLAARDRERRRRRRRTGAVSGLLVLTLVAALLAWQQSRTSLVQQRETAARRAVGVAESLREADPVTAMRLALAAWHVADLPETRSALLAAAGQRTQDVFTDPDGSAGTTRHLSADGRTLLSVGADQVTLWDLGTHRRTASMPGLRTDRSEAGVRRGDAWQVPLERDGEMTLWDLRAGRPATTTLGPVTGGVEMGTSGRSLITYETGRSRRRVQVRDVRDGRRLIEVSVPRTAAAEPDEATWEPGAAHVRRHEEERNMPPLIDASLSPDDRVLAVCVPGLPLQLWDVRTGRRLHTPWALAVTMRQCQYEHVSFTPDSRRLALITDDRVRLWDLASGTEQAAVRHPGIKEIGFSADGAFLVAADATDILLWRLAGPGFLVLRHSLSGQYAMDLRVDPQANWIRYLSGSGRAWPTTVRTLNLGSAVTSGWRPQAAHEAAFSPDGTTLALAYTDEKAGTVRFRLHDRHSGQPLADLPDVPCPASGSPERCSALLAFSSDGRLLAFGASPPGVESPDPRVSLWEVSRGRTTDTLPLRTQDIRNVEAIAFAAGDRSLLIAEQPTLGSLRLWDLDRRVATRTLAGTSAHRIALSPDRRLLVTSQGEVVDLPSVTKATGRHGPGETTALAFSPDGRHLAAGDDTGATVLWDGRVQRRLGVLTPPGTTVHDYGKLVTALAFSPDGTMLAAGSGDGSLQLWDVASREPIGSPLPAGGDIILALAFGPDGRTLYAASGHVPLQKYELSPDAGAATLCRRAGGGLPAQEWKRHFPDHPYRQTCPPRKGA